MVRITGFKNYFFCEKKIAVFSIKKGEIKKIKPLPNSEIVKYALYSNGNREVLSLFEILKRTIKQIERIEKESF